MMSVRLLELRRVMKADGSLYLHCDPTASHYLKLLLDAIFGHERFVPEVIWQRTNARGTTGRWPRLHDVILQYSGGEKFYFHSLKVKADPAKLPHTLITGADGKEMENNPRPVDVPVTRPIGESYQGKDSQLDVAVKELLAQIGK